MSPSGWLRNLVAMTTTNRSNDWNDQSTAATRQARRQRDDALGRIRSITKSIAVASIAGAVAIGLYVSRAVPGHRTTPTGVTAGTTGTTSVGASAGVSPTGTSSSSAGQSTATLAPPNNPPAQTQQPAPVVSGST